MQSTDQFRIFTGAPDDRVLSRPRRLLAERRLTEAEAAYGEVLTTRPELRQAWLEVFELLRQTGRYAEALVLAERARAHFGDDALVWALNGAALVELGRYREGLEALDEAARREPNLALVWHEAGYAAYRLGEFSRALMALDRAFALEPHGVTLQLRGRVLRSAGRFLAAEVAFEGAAQAAEFPAQRITAEHEVRVTRRFAAFPGQRPDSLPVARRWFAETGAVPLSVTRAGAGTSDHDLVRGLIELVQGRGWRFSHLVALDAWEGWYDLARELAIPLTDSLPSTASATPLVTIRRAEPGSGWEARSEMIPVDGAGASFALIQDPAAPPADLFGRLRSDASVALDLAFAVEASAHPDGRLHGRRMGQRAGR